MIGKKINQLATELAPVSTDLTIIGDPDSGVSKKITLAQLGAIFSGAVSFYTNLAAFPVVGDINVIYCAKDTQKLYLWSGSAYTEVFPSQALLNTYQLRSEKGVSNGYASLDSGGKVPISQLPSSIMEYKGTWNAATNTPTLANGTGDTGDVYICNVAGSVNFGAGVIVFAVGDYVIYSGTIWQRSSGAVGTVTSVALSRSGDALAITGSPVTTSGTINVGFAGNSTQYINGAGNLVTFPGVINEAQNLITEVYNKTGATLTKGTIVYINGGQGNLPTVTKALATGDSTSAQTYGIVRNDITNNNNGYVVAAGRISDLDTQAYTEGTQLYLSPTTAGTWTSTKPYAPNHLVYVGIVVRAHPTQGVIEVKIQNGYELDELHNVSAQSPTNNDGIFYNSATSLWEKKSIATVLGYTPQAQLNGTGFVKASGTTISYDNSTYVTTDTFQTISASKTFSVGFSLASAGGTNQLTSFINTNSLHSGSAGSNIFGFNNSNNIYFGKGLNNGGVITYNNAAVRFYALPDADGTIALVGGAGVGTVTSVGLSSATSGVTIGSTPITTNGTITLAIATASGSQQGLLSSTDWTTFNSKQNALTNPVTGTGTTNYLPKFTGASTIGNSAVTDDGTTVSLLSRALSGTSATFSGGGEFGNSVIIKSGNFLYLNNAANTRVGSLGTTGDGTELSSHNGAGEPLFLKAPHTTAKILFITNGDNTTGLRMTLNASGNLSIGNTNNTYKLDVSGTGRFTNTVRVDGTSSSRISLESNYSGGNVGIAFFNTSGTENIWLNAANGSVNCLGPINGGIATFTFLNINSSSGQIGSILSTNANGGYITWETSGTTIADIGTAQQIFGSGGNDTFGINGRGSRSLVFGTNNTARLTIASTGAATFSSSVTASAGYFNSNIIIGSGAASYALDIYGSAGVGMEIYETSTGTNKRLRITQDAANVSYDATYSSGGNGHIFKTGGGAALTIANGGNVGIGTTSPGALLDLGSSYGSPKLYLYNDGTYVNGFGIYANEFRNFFDTIDAAGSRMTWGKQTGGGTFTEFMRLTKDGNVGIGTTSPNAPLEVYGQTRVSASGGSVFLITPNATSTNGIVLESSYYGSAGYGPMNFNTGGAERMRITSGGGVGIGKTASVTGLDVYYADRDGVNSRSGAAAGPSRSLYTGWHSASGTTSGTLSFNVVTNGNVTNTNNSYGSLSDIKLKENIIDTTPKLADLLKVRIVNYNLIGQESKQIGVIAQELETIFPSMIEEYFDKDIYGNDLKTKSKGVKYSVFVPMLIKAVQEQQAQLEELKSQLNK